MKLRKDNEDPRCTLSRRDNNEPTRVMPYIEMLEPRRVNFLTDKELPKWTLSSTEICDPQRAIP
jgi:hypothetical protein